MMTQHVTVKQFVALLTTVSHITVSVVVVLFLVRPVHFTVNDIPRAAADCLDVNFDASRYIRLLEFIIIITRIIVYFLHSCFQHNDATVRTLTTFLAAICLSAALTPRQRLCRVRIFTLVVIQRCMMIFRSIPRCRRSIF